MLPFHAMLLKAPGGEEVNEERFTNEAPLNPGSVRSTSSPAARPILAESESESPT